MTRLEMLRAPPITYPDDVARLRREIPELGECHDGTIERLYRRYSDAVWAAGWYGGPDVEGFRAWLLADVGEKDR